MNDHEICPLCGRKISTNYSGALRKHRCVENVLAFRTVTLRSGGRVTMSLRGPCDPLRLKPSERELIGWLCDQLSSYEAASGDKQ